jgi:nickel superoxide dismutase
MKNLILPLAALAAIGTFALPSAKPTQPVAPAAASSVFHCQVPCGIYGDQMRIAMLLEDAATIEKGMGMLQAMDQEESPNKNQMVRWVMNKDQHAENIQGTVSSYWLAQRIKTPAGGEADAMAKYHKQLELLHRITVAAMKCKQTTDVSHVASLRSLAKEFSESYFSAEDMEHLKEHSWDGK